MFADAHVYLCVSGPVSGVLLEEEGEIVFITDDDGCDWVCLDCGTPEAGGWKRENQLGQQVLQAGMRLPMDQWGSWVMVGSLVSDLDQLRTELSAGQPLDG